MEILLYTAMQKIIKQVLSLPDDYIILANQNQEIKPDCIVIDVINISDTGTHHSKLIQQGINPADNFDEILQSKYNKCMMQLTFKGNNAQNLARQLIRRKSSVQFKRLMSLTSFGLIEMQQITELNDILNKFNYQQAIVEMSFYFADGNYIDPTRIAPNNIGTTIITEDIRQVYAIDNLTINSQLSTPKINYDVTPDSVTYKG